MAAARTSKRRCFVFGATGFLGRYIVDALLEQGQQVTALSRSPDRAARRLPSAVTLLQGDLADLTPADLRRLLAGHDGLVFAAGVDERVTPDTDALQFYRRENVQRLRPVLEAAVDSGVRRTVVLNSIFSTLDRLRPDLSLCRHHPYVQARVEQRDMALETMRDRSIVSVLEIPWVFGDSRGEPSQWAGLVQYARFAPRLYAPRGGTVAISVDNVAQATAGALRKPRRSRAVPIGDGWISWAELLRELALACGRRDPVIHRAADGLLVGANRIAGLAQRSLRLRSGLNWGRMHEFLLDDTSIDLAPSWRCFDYQPGDIHRAIGETVRSVGESRGAAIWRRLVDGGPAA